jgi:hypothetical protein
MKIETKLFGTEKFISKIKFQGSTAEKVYGIGYSGILIIFLSPFFIVFFIGILLQLSLTRPLVVSIVIENQLLMGSLTSVILIAGGLLGLRFVLQIKKHTKELLMFWFYLAFSIVLLFIGMEKIWWGRLFFITEDPSGFQNINQLERTIFHNYQYWRRHLEIFPMAFGLAGLLGIWISKIPQFRKISVPRILWSWFMIITIISAIDLSHDFYNPPFQFDNLINNMEEVIEMMVGISGLLFIWLNTRSFRIGKRKIV